MIEVNATIILMFVVYLGAMLGIGLVCYFKTKGLSDYVLGGRQLNGWVTAMSAQASDMSGWLLMGLPGYAYLAGMEASWIALGLAVGTYLNWRIIAKRLRIYTQLSGDALTIPDFFENRFRDRSKILRMISAIFILIFFLIYTASGFVAGGKLFGEVLGVPYITGLTISVFVIVGYTFLGGYLAVCWTDFIQGIMMFFAVLIVPIVGIQSFGGVGNSFQHLKSFNPHFLNPFIGMDGHPLSLIAIVSLLAWGLGYFGQPHILIRFMGIRSSGEIKQARRIAMIWVVISLTAAVLIGMVGLTYVPGLEGTNAEKVFIIMVSKMFYSVFAGLLLAAVLAAIMSTADSQLLVTSSSITGDFYKVLLRKNASDKELMWVGRISTLLVAIIAFYLALDENNSILGIVAYAWAGFGATFGPAVILSLFWKRMTRNGALAGMIAGGLTVIIWKQFSGGIFSLYEIVPGFIVSMIAIIVVSLIDQEPSEEIQKEFEAVNLELHKN